MRFKPKAAEMNEKLVSFTHSMAHNKRYHFMLIVPKKSHKWWKNHLLQARKNSDKWLKVSNKRVWHPDDNEQWLIVEMKQKISHSWRFQTFICLFGTWAWWDQLVWKVTKFWKVLKSSIKKQKRAKIWKMDECQTLFFNMGHSQPLFACIIPNWSTFLFAVLACHLRILDGRN